MAKKYDIVETSKMAIEWDGSKIVGDYVASTALENGRLVECNETAKTCGYPDVITDKVLLHVSPERLYEDYLGLTEFRIEANGMPRLARMSEGDRFKTTAIDYSGDRANYGAVQVGDKVVAHVGDGKFTVLLSATSTTSTFVGTVIEKTTLGYDKIPAIKIKVEKA